LTTTKGMMKKVKKKNRKKKPLVKMRIKAHIIPA
jgi:hypothetical protein